MTTAAEAAKAIQAALDAWANATDVADKAHAFQYFSNKCSPAALRALLTERTALLAEREQDAKDAQRYRWLLANYARGDGYDLIDAALNDGEGDTKLSPAIDAAVGAQQKDQA
jgi:hypothetical protein